MKNIYTRKIVLLSSIAVLLVIYILQISFLGRSKVKTVYTNEEIDSVEITKNGGHILSLKKENGLLKIFLPWKTARTEL